MTCRNRRLQSIVLSTATESLGVFERRHASLNLRGVPQRAILIRQQDRLTIAATASRGARRIELHQSQEGVNFRLIGKKTHQHPSEPQGLVAKRSPHPLLSGSRGVTLVEDQVDHG